MKGYYNFKKTTLLVASIILLTLIEIILFKGVGINKNYMFVFMAIELPIFYQMYKELNKEN